MRTNGPRKKVGLLGAHILCGLVILLLAGCGGGGGGSTSGSSNQAASASANSGGSPGVGSGSPSTSSTGGDSGPGTSSGALIISYTGTFTYVNGTTGNMAITTYPANTGNPFVLSVACVAYSFTGINNDVAAPSNHLQVIAYNGTSFTDSTNDSLGNHATVTAALSGDKFTGSVTDNGVSGTFTATEQGSVAAVSKT